MTLNVNQNSGKVDKKLFDALYLLMTKNTIDKVTVDDILSLAGVSRSSFYRRYLSKYDLMVKSYEKILESTYLLCLRGMPWRDSAVALYKVLSEHPDFFKNALIAEGSDDLRRYIFNISVECFRRIFMLRGYRLEDDWEMINTVRFFVSGACELMYQWVRDGFKESPESMINLYLTVMPEKLKTICQ